MEADWEFEIGPEAPIIDAAWQGRVDLRLHPERVYEIAETKLVAGLAEALLRLNRLDSLVWTAKCDVWNPEAIDPDELDAAAGEGAYALACYIDLLPREDGAWTDPSLAETFCRGFCATLKAIPARNCRADLIVRRAVLPAGETLGITIYLTACGATDERAAAALQAALSILADSCCGRQAGEQS